MSKGAQLRARVAALVMAYRLRWERRRLLWRSFRKRRQIRTVADRTRALRPGALLAFSTVRNEKIRLPFFATLPKIGRRSFPDREQ